MPCWQEAALQHPHIPKRLRAFHLLTLSNTLKASRISSSLSVSFIFLAIMVKNSGKSIVPFPKTATSTRETQRTQKMETWQAANQLLSLFSCSLNKASLGEFWHQIFVESLCFTGVFSLRNLAIWTLTISIHLIDHVLQFSLCGVLPERPHHSAKLLRGDGAIPVLVEEGEGLLELWVGKGASQLNAVVGLPGQTHLQCLLLLPQWLF